MSTLVQAQIDEKADPLCCDLLSTLGGIGVSTYTLPVWLHRLIPSVLRRANSEIRVEIRSAKLHSEEIPSPE